MNQKIDPRIHRSQHFPEGSTESVVLQIHPGSVTSFNVQIPYPSILIMNHQFINLPNHHWLPWWQLFHMCETSRNNERCQWAGFLKSFLAVIPPPSPAKIGHFRVPKNLPFKARLSVKPLIWKWFLIVMQIKLIFTTKVSHLASFWKWDFLELENGLLSRSARRVVICVSNIKMSDTWRSTVFGIVINQKTSADGFSVYTSFIFSFLGKQSHIIIWFHLLLFNTALWELKHSWKLTKKKLTETNEVRV